jgi:hypothetical protein
MKWSMRLRVARQAGMMDSMLRRTQVDQLALARENRGRTFAAARRDCLECRHDGECARWLRTAPPGAEPPEFCPNAVVFSRFLQEADRLRLA